MNSNQNPNIALGEILLTIQVECKQSINSDRPVYIFFALMSDWGRNIILYVKHVYLDVYQLSPFKAPRSRFCENLIYIIGFIELHLQIRFLKCYDSFIWLPMNSLLQNDTEYDIHLAKTPMIGSLVT